MRKGRLFKGGFTLVEIMIALAILGMAIIPVIGLFSSSAQINYNTNRDIIALTVARDIMDRIKAGDINSSNLEEEIYNYKEKYGVEIAVTVPETADKNSLSKIKVYVAPKKGMDAITQGLLLASYSTNVFIQSIDTSPPQQGGDGGDNGKIMAMVMEMEIIIVALENRRLREAMNGITGTGSKSCSTY